MKYKYLYQTSENENREGWISARDRAEAYAALRRRGIRPYRLVGDDPPLWRRAAPAAAGALAATCAVAAALHLALRGNGEVRVARQQLAGDGAAISAEMAGGWADVFLTNLDRHLAAYAQPGWIALPPETTDEEKAAFADELAGPYSTAALDTPVKRVMAGIVATMREEMKKYLADGGTVADYLDFLEERQDQERDFRKRAAESIARAPESMRERTRNNVNVRLRGMGLPEVN